MIFMRKIINISLSEELNKLVEKEVKKRKFVTKSEFFRFLLRREQEEQRILEELKESQREFIEGKGKLLRSLADLD